MSETTPAVGAYVADYAGTQRPLTAHSWPVGHSVPVPGKVQVGFSSAHRSDLRVSSTRWTDRAARNADGGAPTVARNCRVKELWDT